MPFMDGMADVWFARRGIFFEDSPPLIPIHGLRGDSAAGKPFSRGNRTCG